MKDRQQLFMHHAIARGDSTMLRDALSNGAHPNNTYGGKRKKHTLNGAIRSLLSKKRCDFNLDFIKILLEESVAMVDNYRENTLSETLKYAIDYITASSDQEGAKNNILMLIQILINSGAKFEQSTSKINTLSLAVRTGDLKIINLVVESNHQTNHTSVPDNKNYKCCNGSCKRGCGSCFNTLNCAIKTSNIEIVKIVRRCGALPDTSSTCKNSLTLALLSKNIEIVKEILSMDCLPMDCLPINDNFEKKTCSNWHGDTFSMIYQMNRTSWVHIHKYISKVIDLVMCFGAIPSIDIVQNIAISDELNSNNSKILECYALLNESKIDIRIDYDINSLISLNKQLKSTAKSLIPLFDEKKYIIQNAIMCFPTCCADIVFEYACNVSLLKKYFY